MKEEHVFDNPHPEFLDWIDSNPDRAFEAFFSFACKLFQTCPPRILTSLSAHDREDCISEVIVHCIENNFRVLRTFQKRGPFAAWLLTTARRKTLDHIRSTPKLLELEPQRIAASIGYEASVHHRELLEAVQACYTELSDRCKLLLSAAGEEYKPIEMTALLGLPKTQNKQVGDWLRNCRQRLRSCLAAKGFEATVGVEQ